MDKLQISCAALYEAMNAGKIGYAKKVWQALADERSVAADSNCAYRGVAVKETAETSCAGT